MSRTIRNHPDSRRHRHPWEGAVKAGVTKCGATGKRMFGSVSEAQERADEINLDPRDGVRVFPYRTRCAYCGKWHLTRG